MQSEENICYCVAVLSIIGLKTDDQQPLFLLWWVKSGLFFSLKKKKKTNKKNHTQAMWFNFKLKVKLLAVS